MVVVGPFPSVPTAAIWNRYFWSFFTVALKFLLLVVFQALNFFPPDLEIRSR